jgi:hypothetical protein
LFEAQNSLGRPYEQVLKLCLGRRRKQLRQVLNVAKLLAKLLVKAHLLRQLSKRTKPAVSGTLPKKSPVKFLVLLQGSYPNWPRWLLALGLVLRLVLRVVRLVQLLAAQWAQALRFSRHFLVQT